MSLRRAAFKVPFQHIASLRRASALSYPGGGRTCSVVNPAELAKQFRKSLRSQLSRLPIRPNLRGILLSSSTDSAADAYVRSTTCASADLGTYFEVVNVRDCVELEAVVRDSNVDSRVHGVIVYYPLGCGADFDCFVQDMVLPSKDVEGLCATHRRNLYDTAHWPDDCRTRWAVVPCAALAVAKVLEHVGVYDFSLPISNRLRRQTVTVINRSEIVGKPLGMLLANHGARVYSADKDEILLCSRGKQFHRLDTKCTRTTLADILPVSDIVISGVPSSNYSVPTELLRKDVVAVNVASDSNFRPDVTGRASIYLENLGPITVTMLLHNLLRLATYALSYSWK